MRVTDFSLFLMVKHPEADLSHLPSNLGLTAKRIWKAGESRTKPKGAALQGTYRESYCGLEIEPIAGANLSDAISAALSRLEPKREALDQLRQTGGSVELIVHWSSPGNTGETLEPSLLSELGSLNIALGIDVYGEDPALSDS
jgi:hypothetical protein